MFIVTLLVLTVFLSYTLAGAAGEGSMVRLIQYDQGDIEGKPSVRDLILSNRFWIYLILGIGATLLTSTTLAIAFIMHVPLAAILASLLALVCFGTRSFLQNIRVRRRWTLRTLQLCGAFSALVALVLLLRA